MFFFNFYCSEFQSLRRYSQQLFQTIKSQMPRRESARRKHALTHEYDIMETLNMRLTLLQMTFHKHIKQSHCCFFAGEVLDEVHRILAYLRKTPILVRAHKVTDELFDLSTMAMEYFKEFIEPYLPDINYIGDYHLYDPYTSSPSSSVAAANNSIGSIDAQSFDAISGENNSFYDQLLTDVDNDFLDPASEDGTNTNNVDTSNNRIKFLEKRYKYQASKLKNIKSELKICKRKLNKNVATVKRYQTMFDDYERKFETMDQKLETVMEELTKCRSEMQFLWSKPTDSERPSSSYSSSSQNNNNTEEYQNQLNKKRKLLSEQETEDATNKKTKF